MVNAYNQTIDGMAEPITEFGRVVSSMLKSNLTEPVPLLLKIESKLPRGEFLSITKNQQIDWFIK